MADITKPVKRKVTHGPWKLLIYVSLTEAHAAQTLQYREGNHKSNVSFAFHAEYNNHEYEYKCRLSTHDYELRNDMGEQYF